VAFTLYDNGTCDGNVLYSETVDLPANSASGVTVSTSNETADVDADATVSWRAVYSGDVEHEGRVSGCEVSVLDITNHPGPGDPPPPPPPPPPPGP
jgi:hypothetical protein